MGFPGAVFGVVAACVFLTVRLRVSVLTRAGVLGRAGGLSRGRVVLLFVVLWHGRPRRVLRPVLCRLVGVWRVFLRWFVLRWVRLVIAGVGSLRVAVRVRAFGSR